MNFNKKRLVEEKIVKLNRKLKNFKAANKEADTKKKEAILEAKEEVHKLRSDFERESEKDEMNYKEWKEECFKEKSL